MKSILKNNRATLLGILAGGLSGFLYWKFIGCSSGRCMIQSNPYISTFYGALMGGLLFSSFQQKAKKSA